MLYKSPILNRRRLLAYDFRIRSHFPLKLRHMAISLLVLFMYIPEELNTYYSQQPK